MSETTKARSESDPETGHGAAPRQQSPLPQETPFLRVFPWVFLVSMMFLLTYLDRAMFGPLLPAIEAEFSISHASSTRLLFFMSLGYSCSMFVSGFSSSKIRPRIMVGGAVIATGAVLVLIAHCTNLTFLALSFCLLGGAAGQYFNGGLSTMRSLVTPRQWSKAISVHEVGPNASFFIGPILAEIGAAWFGWRGVAEYMGYLTIAAGVFFLLAAKGGEYPAAPVSFAGFRTALKQPRLWLFAWLMGLAIAGEFAPFSVLTLHMIDERMLSPETSAFLLSASRVAAPFAVLGGGYITTRLGTRKTLYFCLGVYTIGMFLMAMPWFMPFVVGMFVQPVLTAMIFPPVFTLLAESFPVREQPMYLAIGMPVASFMGVGIMPSVLGVWGDYVSFGAGFIMMGCLVAISFPLLRLLPAKQ
ncbi:MFS transporter [Desulfovibrio sp. OttesenSCG-928-G15]|nr:MFS transporter [Desulfovibrio sp. OttesenSCG-928-G15]